MLAGTDRAYDVGDFVAFGSVAADTALASGLIASVTGSSVGLDLSQYNWFAVTLSGNLSLVLANPTVGEGFDVALIQDSAGSRTVTWWAGIKWPGGAAPTLTTAAGAIDVFQFRCVAAGSYYGFIKGQALA